jgi:hypothetical protein
MKPEEEACDQKPGAMPLSMGGMVRENDDNAPDLLNWLMKVS